MIILIGKTSWYFNWLVLTDFKLTYFGRADECRCTSNILLFQYYSSMVYMYLVIHSNFFSSFNEFKGNTPHHQPPLKKYIHEKERDLVGRQISIGNSYLSHVQSSILLGSMGKRLSITWDKGHIYIYIDKRLPYITHAV